MPKKQQLLEELMESEMKELCSSCFHTGACIHQKLGDKKIIQCELFELDIECQHVPDTIKGLCKTCDNAYHCKLPGRREGVWHCNEFL